MYKIDILQSVVKICDLTDDLNFHDINTKVSFECIDTLEQVRKNRSDYHGFSDDYLNNEYYKDNVYKIQTIFEKFDDLDVVNHSLNYDHPINKWLNKGRTKEEIDNDLYHKTLTYLCHKLGQELDSLYVSIKWE